MEEDVEEVVDAAATAVEMALEAPMETLIEGQRARQRAEVAAAAVSGQPRNEAAGPVVVGQAGKGEAWEPLPKYVRKKWRWWNM